MDAEGDVTPNIMDYSSSMTLREPNDEDTEIHLHMTLPEVANPVVRRIVGGRLQDHGRV